MRIRMRMPGRRADRVEGAGVIVIVENESFPRRNEYGFAASFKLEPVL